MSRYGPLDENHARHHFICKSVTFFSSAANLLRLCGFQPGSEEKFHFLLQGVTLVQEKRGWLAAKVLDEPSPQDIHLVQTVLTP